MPRPSKLTDDLRDAIVKSLTIGATRKDASEAAGIDYTTFLNWMARGAKARTGKYFEFFDAASKAEAEARINYTTIIAKAASKGEWRAAIEFLRRRDKDNWSERQEVTGAGGGDLVINVKVGDGES